MREIIKQAKYAKSKQLLNKIKRLEHVMEYRDGIKPTKEGQKQAQKLKIERSKLDNDFNRSIIYC